LALISALGVAGAALVTAVSVAAKLVVVLTVRGARSGCRDWARALAGLAPAGAELAGALLLLTDLPEPQVEALGVAVMPRAGHGGAAGGLKHRRLSLHEVVSSPGNEVLALGSSNRPAVSVQRPLAGAR
jgi:hypothetical protein